MGKFPFGALVARRQWSRPVQATFHKPRRRVRRGLLHTESLSTRTGIQLIRRQVFLVGGFGSDGVVVIASCFRDHLGMRWSIAGGQAIITLRSLLLSNRFDSAYYILCDAR